MRSLQLARVGSSQRPTHYNDAWWCKPKDQAPAADACARRSGEALKLALDELQARLGPDVTAWRWDALHVARAEHRPFSHVKALAGLFELREPVGGDTYTINVSRVNLKADATTGEFYLAEHGPSLRALYDLKDRGASRFMHSSGQSGLPFSPWYREFLKPWGEVGYVPLWGQGVAHQLSLQPAP